MPVRMPLRPPRNGPARIIRAMAERRIPAVSFDPKLRRRVAIGREMSIRLLIPADLIHGYYPDAASAASTTVAKRWEARAQGGIWSAGAWPHSGDSRPKSAKPVALTVPP